MSRMRRALTGVLAVAAAAVAAPAGADAQEFVTPYKDGTVYIGPQLITKADPTVYTGVVTRSRQRMKVYDPDLERDAVTMIRRFDVKYADGYVVRLRVFDEFGSVAKARAQAVKYGKMLGQLPFALRRGVKNIYVHRGKEPAVGNTGEIWFGSIGMVSDDRSGHTEEALLHESVHASLDDKIYPDPAWGAAVSADPTYISDYARDSFETEDVSESIPAWVALRYMRARLTPKDITAIEAAIPNRLAYFDSLKLDMRPYGPAPARR